MPEAEEIADGTFLYRRILLDQIKDGRPTSFGFKPKGGEGNEISLHLGPPASALEGYDGFGLVRFTAAQVRASGAVLRLDPGIPGHVTAVLPAARGDRDRTASALAKAAQVDTHPAK